MQIIQTIFRNIFYYSSRRHSLPVGLLATKTKGVGAKQRLPRLNRQPNTILLFRQVLLLRQQTLQQ